MTTTRSLVQHALVLVIAGAVQLTSVAPARAQALGYGIAGPAGFSGFFGSSASGFHAAGGAEMLAGGLVGGAAEFGVLGNASSLLSVLSLNGVVHFTHATTSRSSPFVTGGYSRFSSGDGSFKAWNFGGGVDFWMKQRAGLRVEFRNHIRPDHRGNVNYWSLRAGVSVR
jgi:hypothetical protein